MQPDDKELLIKLKTRTANQPQSINLASYKLRKAYKRLNDYINACPCLTSLYNFSNTGLLASWNGPIQSSAPR